MADNPWEVSLPVPRREMGDWPEQSACRAACDKGEADPSWWFPIKPSGVRSGPWARLVAERTAIAKAICARCPVKDRCLDWALEHNEQGIWGGLGPTSRRALPKPRTCAECGVRFTRAGSRDRGYSLALCGESCRKARNRRLRIEEQEMRKRGVA